MSDNGWSRPDVQRREVHPGSTLLTVEALGLVAFGASFLGSGVVVAAGLCVILAVVAGGLAASIAEGLPQAGGAVFGFEGVTVAFAASQWSVVAAVALLGVTGAAMGWAHHRRGGAGQIRRPVPCQ